MNRIEFEEWEIEEERREKKKEGGREREREKQGECEMDREKKREMERLIGREEAIAQDAYLSINISNSHIISSN